MLVDESPIRKMHMQMIASDSELSDHMLLINHILNFLDRTVREGQHVDDGHLVVLRLMVRCFNSISASFSLALMGYWQPAFAILRDLLETCFLLDLFNSFPEKLDEWRNLSDNEVTKKYSPAKVRIMLDERDGNNEKKREKIYKMLSSHAAHPTPNGFSLISPDSLTQVGPFPDEVKLRAVLEELARHVYSAGYIFHSANQFQTVVTNTLLVTLSERLAAWRIKYNPSF